MTSLALAMQEAGWQITGSDTNEEFITDEVLLSHGITVAELASPVPEQIDLIVYSTAYPKPTTKVRCLTLAEALAEFVQDRGVIAVAGVGGKTTTSAMLAAMFYAAGRKPGYYVGTSTISGLDSPGHAGDDPYFIVEADEYAISKLDKRPKFTLLSPQILITTNIVHDHPDIYPNEQATYQVFSDLVSSLKSGGVWICNPSDRLTGQILHSLSRKDIKIVQYGSDHELYRELELSVFGKQNQLDALAAVLAGIEAGLTQTEALSAIGAYKGAGRRQEYHGEVQGRLLYDDYGHHPREIELTVNSFKEHFPGKRILLVFESHTYTRTEALLPEFASAIRAADKAFIMPIFESAREKGQPHHITPASFAGLIPGAVALTWDNAADLVWAESAPGDLILTMGAGFVYKLHEQFKLK